MLKQVTGMVFAAFVLASCGPGDDQSAAPKDDVPNGLISSTDELQDRIKKALPDDRIQPAETIRQKRFEIAPDTRSMTIIAEQGFSADAIATLDSCVDEMRYSGSIENACFGLLVSACPGMEGTTNDMVTCNALEFDYWDARLNKAYGEAMALLKVDDEENGDTGTMEISLAGQVRDAQRKWIEFRDSQCMFERMRFRGGTMGRITGTSCMREMTARRAVDLEILRDSLDLH